MCSRSGGDAELPGTTRGETGPPPLSSAAETKPRLGGLKHVPGKSGPENRVRLALNLTLWDLQKLRQGPGSSTPYALPYWDVRGLRASQRPRIKSIWIVCAEEIGGIRKSGGCPVTATLPEVPLLRKTESSSAS